jgi:NAD(P)-dependent dehydrogenase (short-subunit alcohol dehydrogenase family)
MTVDHSEPAPLLIVTGGSRGIGRAVVEAALASGHRVAAIDIRADGLRALRAERGSDRLSTAVVDITDAAAVDGWLTGLVAEHDPPRALVNNAGIVRRGLLEDLDVADWRAVLDVNLTGPFIMTQRVGRHMIANGGGSIVSIGSTASLAWTVGGAACPSSKAGVAMLMRGAALEWGRYGVRANTVSPGYTDTPMTASTFADPATANPRLSRIPLGRIAQPREIARVVLFLCSPEASYVTGQNVVVDGGVLLSPLLAPVATAVSAPD